MSTSFLERWERMCCYQLTLLGVNNHDGESILFELCVIPLVHASIWHCSCTLCLLELHPLKEFSKGVSLLLCLCAPSFQSCPTLGNPMDCIAHHVPQPMTAIPCLSSDRNVGVGCRALLQGVFSTQGLNLHLLRFLALAGSFFTTNVTWEAHPYCLNRDLKLTISNF